MQFIAHWTSRGTSGDLGGGEKTGFGNIPTRLPAIGPGARAPQRLSPGRAACSPTAAAAAGPTQTAAAYTAPGRPPAKPLSSPAFPPSRSGGQPSAGRSVADSPGVGSWEGLESVLLGLPPHRPPPCHRDGKLCPPASDVGIFKHSLNHQLVSPGLRHPSCTVCLLTSASAFLSFLAASVDSAYEPYYVL